MGLREINPLAFGTYIGVVASLVLALPMFGRFRSFLANLNLKRVSVFLLLGFSGYFVAQGLQILGLYYLQAVAVMFILNLTPIFILVLGVSFFSKRSLRQSRS
jgi:drug/metabolite transporter (DMT)-like permease